ncbi:MAG: hypothetical protein GXP48_01520 [Acidobacteria bacterium]|nr:hypothetical protein [Acidobacteriota bacterium]
MRWERFLTTPPPRTAWSLAEDGLAVLSHDRKEEDVCAGAFLEPGILGVGPVGLQTVDRERLKPLLASLQEQVRGTRRPTVIVPTGWVRVHLLELDTPPRRRADLDEVVRWRLKKVLPVRPEELRIDVVPVRSGHDGVRLVCVAVLDRACAELEAAFEDAGMQPAVVTPRVFALSAAVPQSLETAMIVHLDRAVLSILVTRTGRIELLRTKWLPQGRPLEAIVAGELNLTMMYLRERLKVEGEISVLCAAEGGMRPDIVDGWMLERAMIQRLPDLPAPACQGQDGLDASLLPSAWAMIHGGGV